MRRRKCNGMGEGLEVEGASAAKARLHLYAQRGQRHQQYRPVRHRRDPGQQLDQNRLARDDRRRRGQEHDGGLPEGRQARPDEALCDVAGNALRTLDAPGQVRMRKWDRDPALISAMGTSRLGASRRRCSGQGWLRASSTS